ncbi:MAG TPA: hypothetical protein VLG49_07185 [Rhabdochlamydiaceae bacterium]|nr:hypothetical protein [Rhabdochlamydiaceae bacterium]
MKAIFATARTFAPLLDTPHWKTVFGGNDGSSLPLNEKGLLKCIETVLFPKSCVLILEKKEAGIVRIKTQEYPYGDSLFIDERFLDFSDKNPSERKPKMPSEEHILNFLDELAAKQTNYIWGGNRSAGIPEMIEYYPPRKSLESDVYAKWTFRGCDCSGMMHEATEGLTPRNTSSLVDYGNAIPVQNLSIQGIVNILQPLDAIVWKGHVLFVFDQHTAIESRPDKGVVKSDLKNRLEEIKAQGFVPVDDWQTTADKGNRFVVKRWHPLT